MYIYIYIHIYIYIYIYIYSVTAAMLPVKVEKQEGFCWSGAVLILVDVGTAFGQHNVFVKPCKTTDTVRTLSDFMTELIMKGRVGDREVGAGREGGR